MYSKKTRAYMIYTYINKSSVNINIMNDFTNVLIWILLRAVPTPLSDGGGGAYVAEQVLQVVVRGALPLVLGQLLHVAVEAEVQPRQLLLHLTHVLQLLKGAHLAWTQGAERGEEEA